MNTSSSRFLVMNGVDVSLSSDIPPASTFLQTHSGAYTTSRTHKNGSSVLFWERHLRRLAESARILAESRPDFLFPTSPSSFSLSQLSWESFIRPVATQSLRNLLPLSTNSGQEFAITTLVTGNSGKLLNKTDEDEERIFGALDVYVHVDIYIPPVFGTKQNAAHLAVVGRGRDVAMAKFADWVRIRMCLDNLRPPSANELLLSNDGDRILEGCITNFFVVCRKENTDPVEDCLSDPKTGHALEVQTAPLGDGVLPGIIRQLVIEVCLARRIPLREVAPSWSKHELWEEAFITNSLRLVQHVETIRAPSSWETLQLKTMKEVMWEKKCFKEGPGVVTAEIQRELMKKADVEGWPRSSLT